MILSPCEWQRHEWLASRQSLPGGDKTLETDYKSSGTRKQLFLDVRTQLRDIINTIRQSDTSAPQAAAQVPMDISKPVQASLNKSGPTKFAFSQRLDNNWRDLATVLNIPNADQARFVQGHEANEIWTWLENRDRLDELIPAVHAIGRSDLAEVLTNPR